MDEPVHGQAPAGEVVHYLPPLLSSEAEYPLVTDMDVIAPAAGEGQADPALSKAEIG
jgi:hypothetical protein